MSLHSLPLAQPWRCAPAAIFPPFWGESDTDWGGQVWTTPPENFATDGSGVTAPNRTIRSFHLFSFGAAVPRSTNLSVILTIGLHWWTPSLLLFNMKKEMLANLQVAHAQVVVKITHAVKKWSQPYTDSEVSLSLFIHFFFHSFTSLHLCIFFIFFWCLTLVSDCCSTCSVNCVQFWVILWKPLTQDRLSWEV